MNCNCYLASIKLYSKGLSSIYDTVRWFLRIRLFPAACVSPEVSGELSPFKFKVTDPALLGFRHFQFSCLALVHKGICGAVTLQFKVCLGVDYTLDG